MTDPGTFVQSYEHAQKEITEKIGVPEELVTKIYQMYKNSQHKRITAPQAEIT